MLELEHRVDGERMVAAPSLRRQLGSRCRREGVQALTEGTPSLVAATRGWPPVRVKRAFDDV
jgi:hypothetical protein